VANFIYTAISKDGKKQTLKIQADNEEALLNQLQAQGLTVTSIILDMPEKTVSPEAEVVSIQTPVQKRKIRMHGGVKLADLVLFAKQLSTMLNAGVTLLKSLEIISAQLQSRKLLAAVEAVRKDVESGRNFSDSLSGHTNIFSKLWVNLAEAGEASGNLPLVLDRLAHYLEARAGFKSKVISAMIYPLILLIVAVAAVLVFTIFIIPKFTLIFETFQVKLPLITQVLINLSNFLRHGIIVIIAVIVIAVLVFRAWIKTSAGKRVFDKLMLNLPLLGGFAQAMQIEKFASQISMLLESGVPILYALEITQHSMDNALMEEAVGHIKDSVRQGKTFHAPMEESALFPTMFVQMVAIGEEIGELPKMCKEIAIYYQGYIETFIVRLTAMFEPLMIIIMGVVVGIMVVAMYLPIFQMATGGGLGGG
jgi:type IV pilus assembly protein PilC